MVGFPFRPLKVKLLAGDLRAAQVELLFCATKFLPSGPMGVGRELSKMRTCDQGQTVLVFVGYGVKVDRYSHEGKERARLNQNDGIGLCTFS